jgi:predicted nucleotidyltransferase
VGSESLDPGTIATASALLHSAEAVEAAYLLGSAATGRLRRDSDVDIAVLPRHGGHLSLADRLALASSLAVVFGRPVDVGVLSTTNIVYAKEAVATGKIIFERDRLATGRFAMLTLSMYAALQEARREVLRAYAA